MKEFPREKEKQLMLSGAVGLLEAITAQPKRAVDNVTVVICHPHPLHEGTMHNKVIYTLAKAFDGLGLKTIRFNYRGVGQSEGEYGEGIGETEDALAVIAWVKEVCPNDDIWLAGFSFGGYVAARAASFYPAKQLLTVAPSVEHFNFYSLKDIHSPWLVLQGDQDEVVPPAAVFDWVEKSSFNQRLIKFSGVGHFFHRKLVDLRKAVEAHYAAL